MKENNKISHDWTSANPELPQEQTLSETYDSWYLRYPISEATKWLQNDLVTKRDIDRVKYNSIEVINKSDLTYKYDFSY